MLRLSTQPVLAALVGAAMLALPVQMAGASQPGEDKTPPSAAGVAAPINLVAARGDAAAEGSDLHPVPMAVMNYETFEATVDHADLAECPKALAQEGRFCRVVLHGESLHVFAFSEDLDQPLQAVLDVPLDRIRFPD